MSVYLDADSRVDVGLGCVLAADVFQHPLLETPPPRSAPVAVQRLHHDLTSTAGRVCGDCPVRQACLSRAVSEVDVAGFVAGTTEQQRLQLRARLGISVAAEHFDHFAGVRQANTRLDTKTVVELRRARPHASLHALARTLGCSVTTVKRHLKQHARDRSPS